ncbi:MAG: OmpA family protein [Syntrophales bacterium]
MNAFAERIFLAGKRPMGQAAVQRETPASKKVSMALLVEFDTGKAIVRPKYNKEIKKFAHFMKEHPDKNAIIEGHTDNIGGKKYNLNLSQKRAEAVRWEGEGRETFPYPDFFVYYKLKCCIEWPDYENKEEKLERRALYFTYLSSGLAQVQKLTISD